MAAPTVQCFSVSGSVATKSSSITSRSWGQIIIPTSGETWSPVMCKTYTFAGNSASGLKYYLGSVDSNGLKHAFFVSSTYTNPSTINDATKATYALVPTSLPGVANVNDVSAGSDTQYIYEAKSVTNTSTTGLNVTFSSILYYLYT